MEGMEGLPIERPEGAQVHAGARHWCVDFGRDCDVLVRDAARFAGKPGKPGKMGKKCVGRDVEEDGIAGKNPELSRLRVTIRASLARELTAPPPLGAPQFGAVRYPTIR